MIPNRQSPTHVLFPRRPSVPHPPDVLAADPPAGQEPIPPSGAEDTAEYPLPAPGAASAPIVKLPHQKLKTTQHIAHLSLLGGREKQKFEHLRKTKDLAVAWPPETGLRIKIRASLIGNFAHRCFQDIQENFWKDQAKFGSRRPRNYHANHAIFLRVMPHLKLLKLLKVLKVHIFPRCGEPALSEVERGISQAAKTTDPHPRAGNFPVEGDPIRLLGLIIGNR